MPFKGDNMKYSPEYFEDLESKYPVVANAFDRLAESSAVAGPLDAKNQKFLKLGVAIGLGSEGDVQNLTIQALQEGITPDEIRHAVLLSVTTAGFPAMIAAMRWVEDIFRK
jgi:4-carboxymuconolactone decarboxylase